MLVDRVEEIIETQKIHKSVSAVIVNQINFGIFK